LTKLGDASLIFAGFAVMPLGDGNSEELKLGFFGFMIVVFLQQI
jgi:hypothetical protein